MAALSAATMPDAFPISGTAPASLRNPLRKRLENAKREALEAQLGKGESWCTKLLNNESGVRLDDVPALLDALHLKLVDKAKMCVTEELARSYESIVRAATQGRSLLFEDAE